MTRELNKRLQTIGKKIKKDYHAEKVILFGSHAKGTQPKTATWTCFVAPTKERFFERMASIRRLIWDLRDGLAVSPIVLTPGELEKRRGPETRLSRKFCKQEFLFEQRPWRGRRRRMDAIARKDWKRADRNLKDRDSEAAGFFLQQSLEKYLKAFLSSTTGHFERFTSLMLCWMKLPNTSRIWRRTESCASVFPATTWQSAIHR